MLDLASKLTKRFTEAEARRAAKVAAADKKWGDAQMAALRDEAEAMKALVTRREAADSARTAEIADATETFNAETMAASADFSGQTTARLEAHNKSVLDAEKTLNGDVMGVKATTEPLARTEPMPALPTAATLEPAPEG